jgi:cell division protein FtsB
MKIRILSFLIILVGLYACSGNCEEEVALLKNKITEYEQQTELTTLAMNEYDQQLQTYKTKDDSLKLFRDSIEMLSTKMRSSGRASASDNKAMNNYVKEMQRILGENKEITKILEEKVGKGNIGDNPALVVSVLAQNIETKEREIADLQRQITELQKEVKGLKVEIETITIEKDEIASNLETTKDENQKLTEEVKVLKVNRITNKIYNKKGNDITDNKIKLYNTIGSVEICFTLEKNKFADVGNHNIYVCLIKGGSVLTNSSSNLFTSDAGKQIGYTIKTTVNYQGELIRTCTNWQIGNNKIEKGSYEVLIYDEKGRKIGNDLFSI